MWLEVAVGLQGWWSGGKADCEVEEGKEAEELSISHQLSGPPWCRWPAGKSSTLHWICRTLRSCWGDPVGAERAGSWYQGGPSGHDNVRHLHWCLPPSTDFRAWWLLFHFCLRNLTFFQLSSQTQNPTGKGIPGIIVPADLSWHS